MTLYVDTSALVKLYVDEEDSALVRDAAGQARQVATSAVAYVEARAAFARKRHADGLAPAEHRRVVRTFDEEWHRYVRVGVNEALLREAAELAEARRLRGHDAIHLASARALQGPAVEPVVFASWDRDLEAAASREGLAPRHARRRRRSP